MVTSGRRDTHRLRQGVLAAVRAVAVQLGAPLAEVDNAAHTCLARGQRGDGCRLQQALLDREAEEHEIGACRRGLHVLDLEHVAHDHLQAFNY